MQTYTQDIEKLLKEGNCIRFKPQGYSMYPVLVPGRDEVIVAPIEDGQALKRGQVVLYRRYKSNGEKDILVLHRIWKINEQGIYLVGDNQKEVEGPLQTTQMLGIATTIYRKGCEISTDNFWYRLFIGIWLFLRPVRPVISQTAALIKRLCKGISKIFKRKS